MSQVRTCWPAVAALAAAMGYAAAAAGGSEMARPRALEPVVEVEEEVYNYVPADNGAAPMWCYGSTCLVRVGGTVLASGLETIEGAKPLNNVRWLLFRRGEKGWELCQADEAGRTREPCPLACFPDGRVFLSANPTLVTNPGAEGGGPARPEILEFSAADPRARYRTILPAWDGEPSFTEHSYRTFAADGPGREFILFQNVGFTHSEWAFRDSEGGWKTGKLVWPALKPGDIEPYGAERCRCGYPNVVLRDRAVHFCGAAAYDSCDRVHTPELATRKWGPRWRRLYYTWTPDVGREPFRDWVEISNTMRTGGWLFPGDLWVAPDGLVHLVWAEHPIHKGLRDQHFPDIKRVWKLEYARLREGEVVMRRTLVSGGEGISGQWPGERGSPRLQVTPQGRLFACYYVAGHDEHGREVSENRLMELYADGSPGPAVRVPLRHPMSEFFTATTRSGSPPSELLDMLGTRVGQPRTVAYARVRLQ